MSEHTQKDINKAVNCLLQLAQANKAKGAEMAEEAGRFSRLASRHEDGTAPRAVAAFNLFQTPEAIAARLVDIAAAHTAPGARILEPSAGLGRLYREIVLRIERPRVVLVEQSPDCVRELYAMTEDDKSARLVSGDFLEQSPDDLGGLFDAVIMNPPFKMGRDVKHIHHALSMTRTGGSVFSLCYNGVKQRKAFMDSADLWEELPAGSFKSEGTNAGVCLVVIRK